MSNLSVHLLRPMRALFWMLTSWRSAQNYTHATGNLFDVIHICLSDVFGSGPLTSPRADFHTAGPECKQGCMGTQYLLSVLHARVTTLQVTSITIHYVLDGLNLHP